MWGVKTSFLLLLPLTIAHLSIRPEVEIYEIRENPGNGQLYIKNANVHNSRQNTQLAKLLKPYRYENDGERILKELINRLQSVQKDEDKDMFDINVAYILNDNAYEGGDYNENNDLFIDETRENFNPKSLKGRLHALSAYNTKVLRSQYDEDLLQARLNRLKLPPVWKVASAEKNLQETQQLLYSNHGYMMVVVHAISCLPKLPCVVQS